MSCRVVVSCQSRRDVLGGLGRGARGADLLGRLPRRRRGRPTSQCGESVEKVGNAPVSFNTFFFFNRFVFFFQDVKRFLIHQKLSLKVALGSWPDSNDRYQQSSCLWQAARMWSLVRFVWYSMKIAADTSNEQWAVYWCILIWEQITKENTETTEIFLVYQWIWMD